MLAVDTETTGLDLYHGAKPFFVSTCTEDGTQEYWEWDVNPFTRQPIIPEEDIDEIEKLLSPEKSGLHILHNSKFDVTALWTIRKEFGDYWHWNDTVDTTIGAHLLASNKPKNLTDLALIYLQTDISEYEKELGKAVQKAHRIAAKEYPEWKIARVGMAELPSTKGAVWHNDYWLPKAIAKEQGYPEDHEWWTVLRDYANMDTVITMALWKVFDKLIKERKLEKIFKERMKIIPVSFSMEQVGITVSGKELESLTKEYGAESNKLETRCTNIAKSFDYELELPKSGNNKSLTEFVFNVLKLPVVAKTAKGAPSLDKGVLEEYSISLQENSKQLVFIKSLMDKRKRDTALSYMESYQKFWLDTEHVDWHLLHCSINQTGTDTLRFSASNPNQQNISKKEGFNLRRCFGPAPGREWWSLDYENIELRIPAYESGEEAMIELFEKPDAHPYYGSYHLLNAGIVYPDLFWPIAHKQGEFKNKYKATWYQWCKNGGFAIQYGCQEKKADLTFKRKGAYQAIKEKMPKITKLNQYWVNYANKHGHVETLPDKSVDSTRGYPIKCSRSDWGNISPTIPLNYHVQSTAMWCTSKAMVRVKNYLDTQKDCRLIIQVHDELVIDLPKGGKKNLPIVNKVKSLMEMSGTDIGIPLTVSASYHPITWAEDGVI